MLRLRPYKAADAASIIRWIKDEKAFRQWSADRYDHWPVGAEDIQAHYAAFDGSDSFFPMTACDESGVIGHLTMRFTDEAQQVLRFGFVIVDDSKRGRGYGKAMLRLAIRYGFDILHVSKITLGVFENNEPAYRCYRSVGFRDVTPEEPEQYKVMSETWRCREMELQGEQPIEPGLLGKCGFYCGSCPTYREGNCSGCIDAHELGDCFTRDCVLAKGLAACGMCGDFPCETILTQERCTVLDKSWLHWKRESGRKA